MKVINILRQKWKKNSSLKANVNKFFNYTNLQKSGLPRAITFTGSLYSIGIPPELIGTGRGIRDTIRAGKIELLEKSYINLKADLIQAGKFLNKELLHTMAQQYPELKKVEEDIKNIEKYIGAELGPESAEEKEHVELAEKIYKGFTHEKIPQEILTRAALLRKSMG